MVTMMRRLDELHAVAPRLAMFVREGGALVAAFRGAGGLFTVYQRRSGTQWIDIGAPYFICAMGQRPTLVELEGSSLTWRSRDFATQVARGLASGAVRVIPYGATHVLSEDDANAAYGAGLALAHDAPS
jgi:hypothetical protein